MMVAFWIFDLLASDCKISPKTGQVRPRREKDSVRFCCCPSSALPTLQKTFVLSPTCRQKVQSRFNDRGQGKRHTHKQTQIHTGRDSEPFIFYRKKFPNNFAHPLLSSRLRRKMARHPDFSCTSSELAFAFTTTSTTMQAVTSPTVLVQHTSARDLSSKW